MDVVWVNNGYPMEHSASLAQDELYGVDSGGKGELVEVGDHKFYIPPNVNELTRSEALRKLAVFVDSNENHPAITIRGDYWPEEVGVGAGYDVYYRRYKGMNIHWLMDGED